MKRGKSEEPFLHHDENTANYSDSGDDKLNDKDVVGAAAKAQEEQEVYHKIMERRSEWNRNRRGTDDCHVSWRFPPPPAGPSYTDKYVIQKSDDGLSSSDDILEPSKEYTKMLKISKAPLERSYVKPYSAGVPSEEDLVLTVVKFERDRQPKSVKGELSEVSKV